MQLMQNSILLVGSDALFRGELYNFLLAAGYRDLESVEEIGMALTKLVEFRYRLVILDSGGSLSAGLRCAVSIVETSPGTRVILFGSPELESRPTVQRGKPIEFLLKATFPTNLLQLLDEKSLQGER